MASLAMWADARLPLPAVLRAVAAESGGRTRRGLNALAERAESGDSLAQAMDDSRASFPSAVRQQLDAVLAAGGDLRVALPAVAGMIASRARVQREVSAALAYPAVIAGISVMMLLAASLFLIPQFEGIFDEFGLELPAMTEFTIGFSRAAPYAVLGMALALVALAIAALIPGLARYAHWFFTSPPLIGRLWTYAGHQATAQLLSLNLAAAMPAPAALRACAACHFDRNQGRALRLAADRVESGQSLSAALEASMHIEPALVAMVRDGEQRGCTPEALMEAAAVYDDECRDQAKLLGRMIPPLMLISVAVGAVFVVVSLAIPLISLIENLS